jgi:hypothetical protein
MAKAAVVIAKACVAGSAPSREDLHVDQRRSVAGGNAALGGEKERESRHARAQADPCPGRPPLATAEDQRQDDQEQAGRERRDARQIEAPYFAW